MKEDYIEIYRLGPRTQPLRHPGVRRLREGDAIELQTGTWMTAGLRGQIYKGLILKEFRWPWLEVQFPKQDERFRFHIMQILWIKRKCRKPGRRAKLKDAMETEE